MDRVLLRVFQRQIAHQCQAVLIYGGMARSALEKLAAEEGDEGVELETLWAAVQGLLTATANISKALWGQGGTLTEERKHLRESIGVGDDSPLRATSMRNNFDHFDERLDRWWSSSTQRNHVDYVVGPERSLLTFTPTDIFRHFDPETGHVIFWGDRYALGDIAAEIRRILPAVTSEARKHHLEP